MATESVRLLNFGCGATFHPAWVNLDSSPVSPQVIRHDLREPFPFPANSFDGVYGSHVLEHLEPDAAIRLLKECHRVLKPGGIVRVVVPDLEVIARLYLESLEGAAAGDPNSEMRYDWAML
ncbi:MAG: class I SAM-dependent methyltransferase, partial [Burkholderiales bacterium]